MAGAAPARKGASRSLRRNRERACWRSRIVDDSERPGRPLQHQAVVMNILLAQA